MKIAKTFAALALMVVIIFQGFLSLERAMSAPAHLVPDYSVNHYQITPALDVLTQQVCLGLDDAVPAHAHFIDYGIEAEALVSHSLSFSQTFSGSLNLGRLTSWGYTVDRVRTIGDVQYQITDDILTVAAQPASALNIQMRSPTCLFRFPFLYEVQPSRTLLPAVLVEKDN